MPSCFVDLTVTSPPYGNLRKYKGFDFDFKSIAKELFRVTKDGGIVVWIVGDATIKGNETGESFRQALYFKEIGFNLFDTIIYQKQPQGAVGNQNGYWQQFEYMFVLSKGKPKCINLIIDRVNTTTGTKSRVTSRSRTQERLTTVKRDVFYGEYGRRTNVWYYATGGAHSTNDKMAFGHPAIFPEKLALDHIISWSNAGDLVYDPFMGSGTTAKMAMLNNRNYIGSELSKEYCDISELRTAYWANQFKKDLANKDNQISLELDF